MMGLENTDRRTYRSGVRRRSNGYNLGYLSYNAVEMKRAYKRKIRLPAREQKRYYAIGADTRRAGFRPDSAANL